jgi:hypothetical protein
MARGEARLGAGRKKGSASLKTREIPDQAARKGKTPLEVMIGNMRFHDRLAEEAERRLAQGDIGEISDILKFRKLAQEAAKDAAPYIHSRLSSVELSGETAHGIIRAEPLTDEEMAVRHNVEMPREIRH